MNKLREVFPKIGKCIFDTNRIVAIATLVLAFYTYQMVDETRRLVTVSQEQFKIKSYPFIYTEVSPFTVTGDETQQKIKIFNRGEIPAFRLSAMILHGYGEIDKYLRLKVVTTGTYRISSSDQIYTYLEEYNIPPDDLHEISYIQKSTSDYELKDLNYLIVIIKFRVPYDNHLRFETRIFKKVNASPERPMSENTFSWAKLITKDHEKVKEIISKEKVFTQPASQEFLSGYGVEGNEVL